MDDSWHYVEDNCCPICGGRLKEYIDMVVCEDCTYNEIKPLTKKKTIFEEIKTGLEQAIEYEKIRRNTVGNWDIQPNTLQINCELIKMYHKELDIEFEFDTKKLENIDTIEINGHKFVREK